MNRINVLKGKKQLQAKHLIWELWGYEKVDIWETSLLLSPATDLWFILTSARTSWSIQEGILFGKISLGLLQTNFRQVRWMVDSRFYILSQPTTRPKLYSLWSYLTNSLMVLTLIPKLPNDPNLLLIICALFWRNISMALENYRVTHLSERLLNSAL